MLADGIARVMQAQGITRPQLLRRVPDSSTRWAVYRLLQGKTQDPRISTLVVLCQALEVSPTELLQVAGMLPRLSRQETLHDIQLRQAFRDIQELRPSLKPLAVALVQSIATSLDKYQERSDDPRQADRYP